MMKRGSVEVLIGGAVRRIVYDWEAIGSLQIAVGKDFDFVINQAAADVDLKVIAEVLAIGLRRYQPDLDAASIFVASPPIQDAIEAIRRGLTVAFKGGEAPAAPEARPTGLVAAILWRIRRAISSLRHAPPPTEPA